MKKICLLFCLAVLSVSVYAQAKQDALKLYNNGNYTEAISVCEEELKNDPSRIDAYVVMCWALVRNRQYSQAEQRAQEGLESSPHDLRLIEILGEAKYYLGKNSGAMEQFQKYVGAAPESAPRVSSAFYFMGEIYIKQGRYQHADIAFTSACRKDPSKDTWWVRLGYARKMAGNYRESYAAYEEALRLNPANADAKSGLDDVGNKL